MLVEDSRYYALLAAFVVLMSMLIIATLAAVCALCGVDGVITKAAFAAIGGGAGYLARVIIGLAQRAQHHEDNH